MQIEEIEKIIATQKTTGNKELELQLRYWEGYLSAITDIEEKIKTILNVDLTVQSATIVEESERINLDDYEWLGLSTDNFTKYVCRCGGETELHFKNDGMQYRCVGCGKEYHLRVIFKAGNYYFYIKKI